LPNAPNRFDPAPYNLAGKCPYRKPSPISCEPNSSKSADPEYPPCPYSKHLIMDFGMVVNPPLFLVGRNGLRFFIRVFMGEFEVLA